MRHLPNIICLCRIALIWPIVDGLLGGAYERALLLFMIAALSDGLDGWLAKRYGWRSELGLVLDPAADKLLLTTVFVTLAYLKLVPLWLMAAAVARDVIIVLGALIYRYLFGPLSIRPSIVSKLNTLCQAVFIMAVVGRAEFTVPPAPLVMWLGALVFVTVAVSGIDYVLIYGRRALGLARPRTAARAGDRRS